MKIKILSEKTGISSRMIRYYEEQGLIKPNRTVSGYRDFSKENLVTLNRIKCLREGGLSISTIKVVLPCLENNERAKIPYCKITSAVLRKEREKIQNNLAKCHRAIELIDDFLLKS